MRKLTILAAAAASVIAFTPAQAVVIDSINVDKNPAGTTWGANNVGWYYTPTLSYSLEGIATKFLSGDGRLVTASIYSGTVGSLSLLGSGDLVALSNVFSAAALTSPVALSAGTQYFFTFSNVSTLGVNVTSDAGATNLPGGLLFDFGAPPGTFVNGPETGFTAQPIVQFLGVGTGAVPEPSTWAMLILGFGAVGASLRRRQQMARVSFA